MAKPTNAWLLIASELMELERELNSLSNVELKDVERLKAYRKKLLSLKEQAIKNSLQK